MFQESVTYQRGDERRHRRFSIPSRTCFIYAIAAAEGFAAFILVAAIGWLGSGSTGVELRPNAFASAAVAGVLYGWLAINPAHRFFGSASTRQLPVMQAALSWLIAIAGAHLAAPMPGDQVFPPAPALWVWWLAGAMIILAIRLLVYRRMAAMLNAGRFQIERTALVGSAGAIRDFQRQALIWRQGGQVVATQVVELLAPSPAPETMADFAKLCVRRRCDYVLLVGDLADFDSIDIVVGPCRQYALNVVFAPLAGRGSQPRKLLDVLPLGPANSVRVLGKPLDDGALAIKRIFDVVAATLALVLLLPVLLVVAALVKLTSPGPVLYRQERRGFNGRSFHILKFRSMSVTEDGRSMTPARSGDARITRLGRFLRRTSIDELPQLLNVLRGDMSLVGPRPHAISHDAELSRRFAVYAQRQRIKPGITGWAQVKGYRGDVSTQEKIEGRTLHDLYYVENWALELDIWILMLTLFSKEASRNAG